MDGLIKLISYFLIGTVVVVAFGIFIQLGQQKKSNKRPNNSEKES